MIPGYSGLKQYGHSAFLATALLFFLLLDAFLIVNFYWTAFITANQRNILFFALVVIWVLLMSIESYYRRYLDAQSLPLNHDERYREAMCLYLQGNWVAVESLILPYLQKYPKDIEMLLLQASMYRHSERFEEASALLDKLQLLQGSKRWFVEIETERKLLKERSVDAH